MGSAGFPLGLTKFVSEFKTDSRENEIKELVVNSISFMIFISIILIIVTIILARYFSSVLLDNSGYYYLFIIVSFSFPFSCLVFIFEAYIKGIKQFGTYVKLSIITSIISLFVFIGLVYFYGIMGIAISIFVTSIISFVIYYFKTDLKEIVPIKNFFNPVFKLTPVIKVLLKLGLASLIVGIVEQLSLLSIRTSIIRSLGPDSLGIFQCVNGISGNYINIFFVSLSIYALPVLSGLKDTSLVNLEINNILTFSVIGIVIVVSFTFVFREIVILALYSEKFLPATNLFLYFFIGDFFKCIAWILGSWLIPSLKIKQWFIFSVSYYVFYVISAVLLFSFMDFDLKSIVIAYCLSNLLYCILNLVYIAKKNYFRFNKKNIRILAFSVILLSLLFSISIMNKELGYIIIVPLLIIWIVVSINKEDFGKIIQFAKTKLSPSKGN